MGQASTCRRAIGVQDGLASFPPLRRSKGSHHGVGLPRGQIAVAFEAFSRAGVEDRPHDALAQFHMINGRGGACLFSLYKEGAEFQFFGWPRRFSFVINPSASWPSPAV